MLGNSRSCVQREYGAEPIMARGHFVGLFLRGIAQQATGTGTAMVGSLAVGCPRRNGRLVGTRQVSFAPKDAVRVACEITKPCRLWDGGSVSSWMKTLAAWLASQAANFPAWYGSYHNDSIWVITNAIVPDSYASVEPYRTRKHLAGPLAPLGCAALRSGACQIGSGSLPSAYPNRNRYSSFLLRY